METPLTVPAEQAQKRGVQDDQSCQRSRRQGACRFGKHHTGAGPPGGSITRLANPARRTATQRRERGAHPKITERRPWVQLCMRGEPLRHAKRTVSLVRAKACRFGIPWMYQAAGRNRAGTTPSPGSKTPRPKPNETPHPAFQSAPRSCTSSAPPFRSPLYISGIEAMGPSLKR